MNVAASTTMTYQLMVDSLKSLSVPVWTQTPACGYGIVYTATITKTAKDANSLVSEAPYASALITDTVSSSGVTFDAAQMKIFVQTNDRITSGQYTIDVTATLQESKYNLALNVNTESFTLTITDPCTSTQLNNLADTTLNVQLVDMTYAILQPANIQTYHEVYDSVGMNIGCTNNGFAHDSTCFEYSCGDRSISWTTNPLGQTYSWLSVNEIQYKI